MRADGKQVFVQSRTQTFNAFNKEKKNLFLRLSPFSCHLLSDFPCFVLPLAIHPMEFKLSVPQPQILGRVLLF